MGPVITPPYFLATKLAAFKDRGLGNLYMSKDFEDVLVLLEGCKSIALQVEGSDAELRGYIASELTTNLMNNDFVEAVPGYFRSDTLLRQRMSMVRKQIARLAAM